jgi:hypothetical protein
MSDSYSYDADVTDPNELDPIERMCRDLVDYRINVMPVSEMLIICADRMMQDLENRPLSEVQAMHDQLFAGSGEVH